MRLCAAVLAWVLPVAATAQTSDLLLGSWSWRERDHGSRLAGLGGAYVALADGVHAVAVNPAGLALIPRVELSISTADVWAGAALSLRGSAARQAPAGACPTRRARPLALGVFYAPSESRSSDLDVVLGAGRSQIGRVSGEVAEVGVGAARGVLPWLNAGATVSWRQLRLDAHASEVDIEANELRRLVVGGNSSKARLVAGLLGTIGRASSPTAIRLGVSWEMDLTRWTVEQTLLDRVGGTATRPVRLTIPEPSVLAVGGAWRLSDTWTVTAQLDRIFYEPVVRTLRDDRGAAVPEGVEMPDAFEPRLGVEVTWPSPTGGSLKLRAGVRKESAGRLAYRGDDPVSLQAFRLEAEGIRGGGGASLLAEFYQSAFRLDLDYSQLVLERRTSLDVAGSRRFSLSLTVRP